MFLRIFFASLSAMQLLSSAASKGAAAAAAAGTAASAALGVAAQSAAQGAQRGREGYTEVKQYLVEMKDRGRRSKLTWEGLEGGKPLRSRNPQELQSHPWKTQFSTVLFWGLEACWRLIRSAESAWPADCTSQDRVDLVALRDAGFGRRGHLLRGAKVEKGRRGDPLELTFDLHLSH